MIVRDATEPDIAAVQAVYGHAVATGSGTFEYETPPLEEMLTRWRSVVSYGLPYLVAEIDGEVAGYGACTPFRPRTGYRFTVEDSLYVGERFQRRGVAGALLAELIHRCERAGFRQMVAVIGDSGNAASLALHRRAGFEHAGSFRSVGYKHERWTDIVFMQRALGRGDVAPPDSPGLAIREVWGR
jgi:phosphinothricin acetyltransferase